jgi:hypothetical protein
LIWRRGLQACFAAGTPLRTPTGSRAIEDLAPGDLVLSRDEHRPDGLVTARRVEEVFVREGLVWELRLGGQTIRTTAEHPFYSEQAGWTACHELQVGDRLLTEDGSWVAVEGLHDTGSWERVYNLRVADNHTYFVGEVAWGWAVWAHNMMCGPDGSPLKPISEMTPEERLAFTTERAEQLRSSRLRQHDMGDETWDVGIVKQGDNYTVVITTNAPFASMPRSLPLAPGEVFRTPASGTLGARASTRNPAPHDPIGNAHHAEPRMEAVLLPGEQLLAHSPTRGLCVLCQHTIDVTKVPVTHLTADSYAAWRASQVAQGALPKPPIRIHRAIDQVQYQVDIEYFKMMWHELQSDRAIQSAIRKSI